MQVLSEWFHVLQPRPSRPRLVCFPYAGGGVAAFRTWGAGLADVAEIAVARLPGRESRLSEPALTDALAIARAAAASLADVVARGPERPYALFGHSLGALIALEVARALRARGGPQPRALFASGHRGPSWPERGRRIAALPRRELLRELHELAGTPPEVLADDQLMDLLLPMMRADFTAAETYRRPPGPPLDVRLLVYAGQDDEDTPAGARAAWGEETTARPLVERAFPGGHFFIQSAEAQVWDALRQDLRAIFEEPARG